MSTNTVIFFGLVIQFSTNPVTTERRTRSGSLSPVNCCLKRNLGDKVTTKKLSTFNSWKVMRIKNNPKPTKLFQGIARGTPMGTPHTKGKTNEDTRVH